MFQGVVPTKVRQIIRRDIASLPETVQILCSGNFSVETTLRANGYNGRVCGCDVSLYTCSLGSALTDTPFRLDFRDDMQYQELEAFHPFMATPEGCASVVAVSLDVLQFAERKNDYAKRMWDAYVRRFEELLERTLESLEKKKERTRLDDFYPQDAVDRLKALERSESVFVYSFPPTYSAGYERLYKRIDAVFDWDAPSYAELTAGAEFSKMIAEHGCDYCILAEELKEDEVDVLGNPDVAVARGASKTVYLYKKKTGEQPALVRRHMLCGEEVKWKRISGEPIADTDIMEIHKVSTAEANYLRTVYLSVKPKQCDAMINFVLTLRGEVIGCLMYSLATFGFNTKDGTSVTNAEYLYLMADFSVMCEHKKLSKLVAGAALSFEVIDAIDKHFVIKTDWVFTTAFSNNPVSMKYRGVFTLHSRAEEDGGYLLNYYGKTKERTLQEVFREWLKKHRA
jgi:hypothetical protein